MFNMNHQQLRIWVLLAASPAFLAWSQVEWVTPSAGSQGFMLEPTRPTVSLPNSMVRVYPVRKDQLDDQIHSFPLTIISHRLGELFWLMPADGRPDGWDRAQAYDQEVETPYYYATRFDDSLIRTEFTPTAHAGIFRFTFPTKQAAILLGNRRSGSLQANADGSVSGTETFKGESRLSNGEMAAYVYGEFDQPIRVQTGSGGAGSRLEIASQSPVATLQFRYAISFISPAQAKSNYNAEVRSQSFETVKQAAAKRWNEVLGQIQVTGGTPEQKRVFYTSLYRCYERMVNITEDGKYYSAFDHQVHADPRPFVVGFAAETERVEEYARAKLERKRLDLIAANEVGAGLGFEREDNALLLLWPGGREALDRGDKADLARALVARIARLRKPVGEQHA